MNLTWHATPWRVQFTLNLVIVMDTPLDSSTQEGNTESYSRSLHESPILENFCFIKFQLLRKLRKFSTTKIWCYVVVYIRLKFQVYFLFQLHK